MIGDGYWSTGITLTYHPTVPGWHASARYYDDGFGHGDADGQISTIGLLESRYVIPDGQQRDGLTAVIDAVKADAEQLGIHWRDPALFVSGGPDPQQPLPDDWRTLLDTHAHRLGWDNPYPPGSGG